MAPTEFEYKVSFPRRHFFVRGEENYDFVKEPSFRHGGLGGKPPVESSLPQGGLGPWQGDTRYQGEESPASCPR